MTCDAVCPGSPTTNITFNQHLVTRIGELALELGCSPAQFALAWLVAQGVVPIPGAQRRTHMSENASAGNVTLTADVSCGGSTRSRPPAPSRVSASPTTCWRWSKKTETQGGPGCEGTRARPVSAAHQTVPPASCAGAMSWSVSEVSRRWVSAA
ncbi:aldo/keto reductase [Streptomyces sp. NPDC058293]|uniref:aldo/keto reductase n=1 Tax=Streptomyces sp. NPDC058293 TaxID=3346429 RepID=UPI0036E54D2B